MEKIEVAVILGAGFGKRLSPITNKIPKPLVEFGNETILEKTIKLVKKLNLKKILINIHYKQDQIKKFIRIKDTVKVSHDDAWAQVSPFDGFKVDFTMLYDHPVHKDHATKASVNFNSTSFVREVSRARTFGFMSELETLNENNLALGASVKNTIAIGDDCILNEDGLRNRHEFVYHKILDCLGDIMLSGNRIFGHIKTSQGGHALTNKLLTKFFSDKANWKLENFENIENQNDNSYKNSVAIGA